MIDTLFNNSLGVSEARDKALKQREAARWLGDVNDHYNSTRDICPAPKVTDAFRKQVRHQVPMILIHGDLDLSTPYRNASFLMEHLDNGHLLTVRGGSHGAKRHLIQLQPKLVERIYQFFEVDVSGDNFRSFSENLPTEYQLPAFKFWTITGESLFEKYTKPDDEAG